MITIICGTNRPNSNSSKVAKYYGSQLAAKGVDYQYFSLEDVPQDVFVKTMYDGNTHEGLNAIQDNILKKATKFVFVYPEYNGSYPGILKAFIDATDIVNCWHNKKAALVGVAAGRAGNLVGLDQFTTVLNHIKINVLHNKLPMSGIDGILDEHGNVVNEESVKVINQQIDLLLDF